MAKFGLIISLALVLTGLSLGQVETSADDVLQAVLELKAMVGVLVEANDIRIAKQEAKLERKAARKEANSGFVDPIKEAKRAAKKAAKAAQFENCVQVQEANNTESGVYTIYPSEGRGAVPVYCDLTTNGGGWTVFQRRQDGSVDFNLGWELYVNGFGNPAGEYWLGLDNMRSLVEQDFQILRVELEAWDGTTGYAEYHLFDIAPAEDKYRLTVNAWEYLYTHGATGGMENALGRHNGGTFSTYDQENNSQGYANRHNGGWWYGSHGFYCDLNGKYYGADHKVEGGVNWKNFLSSGYLSLKGTTMMMRPSVLPSMFTLPE